MHESETYLTSFAHFHSLVYVWLLRQSILLINRLICVLEFSSEVNQFSFDIERKTLFTLIIPAAYNNTIENSFQILLEYIARPSKKCYEKEKLTEYHTKIQLISIELDK